VDALPEEEQFAIELAERLSTESQRVIDFRESFGEAGFVDLLLFVSLEMGLDRFTIGLALTADEKSLPFRPEVPFEADDV
jgi:hypothetical protein